VDAPVPSSSGYRGRIAPSPTGYLHLGHARTFWIAQERARNTGGTLVLRNEDIDRARCRPEFVRAMIEDLAWVGFRWQEGPDIGGPCAPYDQSARTHLYAAALRRLYLGGYLYPCACSRQDVLRALSAPHAADDEPVYPGTCRQRPFAIPAEADPRESLRQSPARINWRFRVLDGDEVRFEDALTGPQVFVAGRDFGDFVVWRHDDVPAYQLAVTVDDAAMGITEVVRGMDLLVSTARQLLLYKALGLTAPMFCHCPLVTDDNGVRLAKRHESLSLRALRAAGQPPAQVQARFRL
jgi:glutamyl-tRNA synthetase